MPNIYLSDLVVAQAICPAEKDQEIYWDYPIGSDGVVRNGSVAGLGLRVTALGNKTFVHAYVFNQKRHRKALGSTIILNVASARLAVIDRERRLQAGENPDLDENDPRRIHLMTVREAIDRYWESHVSGLSEGYKYSFVMLMAKWLRQAPKLVTKRGSNIRNYADFGSMFLDRPLSSIKPLDIERYQKQFASPYVYNTALRHVLALFNWAIRMQLVDMRNPAHPLKKRKIIRQRRDYSMEQIRQITAHIFYPVFEAVPDIDSMSGLAKRDEALVNAHIMTANDQMAELCNYMGILFLTMARPSDLASAEFTHFDLVQLIWNKHNTKGIKLSRSLYEYAYRTVPIHSKVAAMIRAQRDRWPDSRLVFPSHTDLSKPRDNFRKGLARFKALPGVPDHFQLYDLKRIAISLMLTGQGVSREAVSHYVDHKGNLETTMI
ncbi:integrase family protein [Agrobacterium sp. O3.4]|uniref:tyrosine-type recombinase/integrase n=1 Tax=Rhizobium/Agrobacterium group TaxID=227290 RepID=UPI0022B6B2B0|nr:MULTISPECIES: integrase family protein [Rhizobium/Agrobacterium group]MCZ7469814.1 integrase family protein [Rhizobium rhizogenes]